MTIIMITTTIMTTIITITITIMTMIIIIDGFPNKAVGNTRRVPK
jgi:hypothetical protein